MKTLYRFIASAAVAGSALAGSQLASAREYISIVGSSTVYPFATVVAERFGKSTGLPTPTVEGTGTGGGMKLFCSGVGVKFPDISNASRRMKQSEFELCQKNGVKDVVEVQIGFDGLVLANALGQHHYDLSRKDIFLALAKNVPNPDGSATTVPNPYKTWKDVNPQLPANKIEVMGPPPTSGTRDAFAELVMEGGCEQFPFIKAMKEKSEGDYKAACHTIREDGFYVEAGENDNLIVQKLEKSPNALGVFGFSFLDQNSDKVQGSLVEGQEPTFEAIADKSYPVSRPLYMYVKKAHIGVVPGIKEYLRELTSEKAWGDEGYLADKGMIALGKGKRVRMGADVRALKPMSGKGLH